MPACWVNRHSNDVIVSCSAAWTPSLLQRWIVRHEHLVIFAALLSAAKTLRIYLRIGHNSLKLAPASFAVAVGVCLLSVLPTKSYHDSSLRSLVADHLHNDTVASQWMLHFITHTYVLLFVPIAASKSQRETPTRL